jgi:hypothetical protein
MRKSINLLRENIVKAGRLVHNHLFCSVKKLKPFGKLAEGFLIWRPAGNRDFLKVASVGHEGHKDHKEHEGEA